MVMLDLQHDSTTSLPVVCVCHSLLFFIDLAVSSTVPITITEDIENSMSGQHNSSYYQYDPLEITGDEVDKSSSESTTGIAGTSTKSVRDDGSGTIRQQSLMRSFLPFSATSKDNLAEDVEESNRSVTEDMVLLIKKAEKTKAKKQKGGNDDEDDDDDDQEDGHNSALLARKIGKRVRRGGENTMTTYTTLLYCVAFVCAVTLCYGAIMMTQKLACLGPPYLYVTHQESRNIMKFSRDGCLIHEKVLWGLTTSLQSNLRSMVFGQYNDKPALYVADSDETKSGIMVFGSCMESSSLRPFIRRIAGSVDTSGSQHTYGIAIDQHGDVYASFQKTDAVLRFSAHRDFAPMENEADLKTLALKKFKNNSTVTEYRRQLRVQPLFDTTDADNVINNDNESLPVLEKKLPKEPPTTDYVYFPGTFVQFGAPNWHNTSEQGVRAILWAQNFTELWISNEDVNQVVIVNRRGHHIDSVYIHQPVGLYYTATQPNVIFVASKNKKAGGVYAVNIVTRQVVKSYIAIGMKHPTGMVSYNDVLFVGDQTRNAVITFNLTTGRVIKMIIPDHKIKGYIEQLTLSDC
jgi:hypothetical protein